MSDLIACTASVRSNANNLDTGAARGQTPPQGYESYLNTMVKNRMVKPFLHGVHLKNKMNTMGIYLNIMVKKRCTTQKAFPWGKVGNSLANWSDEGLRRAVLQYRLRLG
ncbi:MAG: hypothetical protein UH734_04435 [Ruminococcus sp.]|nr:hypothetical protein [Ruminococcus sp.]